MRFCAAGPIPEAVFGGHDAAVAEDGELIAQSDLGDADLANPVRFAAGVQDVSETRQDRAVLSCISAQLGNRLGDQHVEPVQALGLVAFDIVVRLREDGGYAWPASALFALFDDASGMLVTQGWGRRRIRARALLERV